MTHLVLAGGGHAHLFVLEALARGRFPAGLRVTLVVPDPRHVYSGMVPGLIEGRYAEDELTIDLGALARRARADLTVGAVAVIDAGARTVTLEDGRRLEFDLLSLAIGSGLAGAGLPGVAEHAILLKPIDRTPAIVTALERAVRAAEPSGPRVAVVGGGAAGVELALTLRARLRTLGRAAAPLTVLEAGNTLLQDRSRACRRLVADALARHGIAARTGSGVARIEAGRIALVDGSVLGADLVLWATGSVAPELPARSGLATDDQGYVLVDETLRSVSHPEIFAAGDIASPAGAGRIPKAGVYSVRQGPVLSVNLAAAAAGRPTRAYRPQRTFLALLNTGDGRAVCSWGSFAAAGAWAMRLKDGIDRRFMRRFQA